MNMHLYYHIAGNCYPAKEGKGGWASISWLLGNYKETLKGSKKKVTQQKMLFTALMESLIDIKRYSNAKSMDIIIRSDNKSFIEIFNTNFNKWDKENKKVPEHVEEAFSLFKEYNVSLVFERKFPIMKEVNELSWDQIRNKKSEEYTMDDLIREKTSKKT